jgi:hypothetical protein
MKEIFDEIEENLNGFGKEIEDIISETEKKTSMERPFRERIWESEMERVQEDSMDDIRESLYRRQQMLHNSYYSREDNMHRHAYYKCECGLSYTVWIDYGHQARAGIAYGESTYMAPNMVKTMYCVKCRREFFIAIGVTDKIVKVEIQEFSL